MELRGRKALITGGGKGIGRAIALRLAKGGADVALFEVDEESGNVRVLKVLAAHDVGKSIHPRNIEGQIEGGVVMGLGYALSENFPSTGSVPDSLKLRDLGILRAAQTLPINVILIEVPDGVGGYGSKGAGEIGLVPTAGAVAAALYAHDGIRRTALPMADAPAAQPSLPRSRKPKT